MITVQKKEDKNGKVFDVYARSRTSYGKKSVKMLIFKRALRIYERNLVCE
jgi:hypothetical protein